MGKEVDRKSNFIGQYFRQFLKLTGFDRKVLIKKLEWGYANNDRMLCAYLTKKDYLWEQYEVEQWCKALGIKESVEIYSKLIDKCGKKRYDYCK